MNEQEWQEKASECDVKGYKGGGVAVCMHPLRAGKDFEHGGDCNHDDCPAVRWNRWYYWEINDDDWGVEDA